MSEPTSGGSRRCGGARPSDIADCFQTYQPAGWTTATAALHLDTKLRDTNFRTDLDKLVIAWPAGYTIAAAAEVARTVLHSIDRRADIDL